MPEFTEDIYEVYVAAPYWRRKPLEPGVPVARPGGYLTVRLDAQSRIIDCLEIQCIFSPGFRYADPDKFNRWFEQELQPDRSSLVLIDDGDLDPLTMLAEYESANAS